MGMKIIGGGEIGLLFEFVVWVSIRMGIFFFKEWISDIVS